MREYATPLAFEPPSYGNLTDDLVDISRTHPRRALLATPSESGWTDVVASEVHDLVRALARGLVASGLQAGERVLLQCSGRFEWTLMDYAIWFAGGVSVPAYASSSADQVAWMVSDCAATMAVVETADQERTLLGSPRAPQVWCLTHGAFDALTAAGAAVTDAELEARRRTAGPSSPATVIYTSGTTGNPRGCVLTHGNLMTEVRAAVAALDGLFSGEGSSTLLVLPLAHVFPRVVQLAAVHAGVRLGYGRGPSALAPDLRGFGPTFLLVVPRLLENLYTTMSNEETANGRGHLFERAVDTAIAYSRALESPRGPNALQRARHRLYDRRVYSSIRASLGGRCTFAITGGAPTGERLAHFFRGCGIEVLEGYGLTETSAAVTVNTPENSKVGTAGRPLPGVSVRVDDDGELLVTGGQVFAGYWRDDAATRAMLDEHGWLRTGDIGEIDSEGFVRVTGRRQELLVTAGGKTVAPEALEDRVRAHPLVDQCLLVGDGRPFLVALVTLDPDALASWVAAHGRAADADLPSERLVARLADDDAVRAAVQEAVDSANAAVSQSEAIRRFLVLPELWTEDSGHLTPSLKLRRSVALRTAAAAIDGLYAR